MKKIGKPVLYGISLIIIYTYLNNPGAILSSLSEVFSYFSVFFYGGIIAFLLNPLLKFIEKKIKIKRKYSIAIIYLSLLVIISLFFSILVPKLMRNISDLIENYPQYINSFGEFIDKFRYLLPAFKDVNILNELLLLQQKALIYFQQEFTFLLSQFLGVTAKILSLIFSIIFSVFFLGNKEYFHNLSVEVLELLFSKETSTRICVFSKRVERVFLGYLSGKSLDSLIIGGIAIVGLFLLKVPYIILLGIFITVFNFIPYVGPLFGILLGVTIALFTIPSHAIFVLIFLILLQQFDAWILEPRILGNSLNLSMFWTIAAVTLGGGILGAMGIIIAIPGFALIKELYILKLEKKNI